MKGLLSERDRHSAILLCARSALDELALRRSNEAGYEAALRRSRHPPRAPPGNLARASAFCTQLFGWLRRRSRSALLVPLARTWETGSRAASSAGARELAVAPYVEVPDLAEATERACELGATVMLEPREAAGWRSIVAVPAAADRTLAAEGLRLTRNGSRPRMGPPARGASCPPRSAPRRPALPPIESDDSAAWCGVLLEA